MRKQISLVFLLVAYVILLGHSIIPHHHHETNSEVVAHHETHHLYDVEHSADDLGHLLSHFVHPVDVFTTDRQHYTSDFSFLNFTTFLAIIPNAISYTVNELIAIQYKPPISDFILDSSFPIIQGLRGPPFFIS